jgi:cytochrome c553
MKSFSLAAILCAAGFAQPVDFVSTIHPILARCAPCHGGDKAQGGLSVTSRESILKGGISGPAILPGQAGESLLIRRVTGAIQPAMPLQGARLTEAEIKNLRDWIDQNAPWTDTSRKEEAAPSPPLAPRRPAVPESRFSNPIDRFLEVYFQNKKLAFPAPVPDELFVRRVYLDVWGLAPSAAAVTEFLTDRDPEKREKLIDKLLADSTMYTGHWISFWNDLLRNDQGVNYAGMRKSITEWLQPALGANLPYDQMVRALLNPAKDIGPEGFLLGVNWRGDVNASQTSYMQASQNTAQIFLGVNLKCASCHDSFINRYKLKQSYGMAALFAEQSQLELVRCDAKTGQFTGPAFLFPEIGSVPQNASVAERREAAARLFTSPENGRLARTLANRMWQRFFDHGLVEPVDEMDNQAWDPGLLDWLATDFTDHGYDLKQLMRRILVSRAYQLPSIPGVDERGKPYTFRGPRPRRVTAEQFADMLSAVTGEWRILQTDQDARFSREWQLKSTTLTRAMGRPIRDQVYTTRNPDATTLQALELANGEAIGIMLRRGARRLLGQLPAPAAPVFDSKTFRKGNVSLDVDLTGVKKLWLVLSDVDCYDPGRTLAGWADIQLTGPKGAASLGSIPMLRKVEPQSLTSDGKQFSQVLAPGVPSMLVVDIDGLEFTRMQGSVAMDDGSVRDDINPKVRFFVFAAEPDQHQLLGVTGEAPVAPPPVASNPPVLIRELYLQLLGRAPAPRESQLASRMLAPSGKITASGLEDLLWSLLLHPEFQYIY